MSSVFFEMFAGMVFYKHLAALGMVCLLFELTFVAIIGRKLASRKYTGVEREILVSAHEWWTQMALWTMVVLLVLIELLARVFSKPHSVNYLLYWPNVICGIVGFLVFVAVRYWFNGERFPRLHHYLVYTFGTLFSVALVTGIPMLYELPLVAT